MVVQTEALASALRLEEHAAFAQPRAGRRGRVVIGAVVVLETAWLLALAWGAYALVL